MPNPSLIIQRVRMLTEYMQEWECRSGLTLDTANYVQSHGAEQVSRFTGRLANALNSLHEDQHLVLLLQQEYELSFERKADLGSRVEQSSAQASQVLSNANNTVDYWNNELSLAYQWLSQAQNEERQAKDQRDQAQRDLQQAHNSLMAAESDLASARNRTEYVGNDKEGKPIYRPVNTAPYVAAVHAAQDQVDGARRKLSDAESRLSRAIQNRKAAEDRVAICKDALNYAEQALRQAKQAEAAMFRAKNDFGRLSEETARAGNLIATLKANLDKETIASGEAKINMDRAHLNESSAKSAIASANREQVDARQYSTQGRMETEWRIDQLQAFDQPMP